MSTRGTLPVPRDSRATHPGPVRRARPAGCVQKCPLLPSPESTRVPQSTSWHLTWVDRREGKPERQVSPAGETSPSPRSDAKQENRHASRPRAGSSPGPSLCSWPVCPRCGRDHGRFEHPAAVAGGAGGSPGFPRSGFRGRPHQPLLLLWQEGQRGGGGGGEETTNGTQKDPESLRKHGGGRRRRGALRQRRKGLRQGEGRGREADQHVRRQRRGWQRKT